MLRKKLLLSQNRFHKIYQERIVSANGRQEAMKKDLADFDKGIELLMQGRSYRTGKNEMKRFLTVYGWIVQRNLPQSFLAYVWRKNINTHLLAKSPNFAYIVGVYQARIRAIHPQHIRIRTGDSSLEHEVETCFRALHMVPSKKKIVFKKIKHSHVLCYNSVLLMSYISEITENNTRIPHAFFIPNLMHAYLSGFCDAHSSPTYYKSKPKCSSIIRKYPRIVITKQGNVPLLSAVNSALNFLGIASVYNLQSNPSQIYILALESIKKFIDAGIYRSHEKMGKLKELYDYWKDTNEFDYAGAFQKQKNKILLKRLQEKKTEFDEAEPTDEDSDEEIPCFDEEEIED